MSNIPYIIATPDYRGNSGVRVLFKMAKLLAEKGYEVYVNNKVNDCPFKVNTIYGDSEKTYKLIQNGAIVVYPEIFSYNFLSSSRPVGYVLNPQRDLPYKNTFYYNDFFKKGKNLLTINVFDKSIFNNNIKEERIWNTVWIGKGNGEDLPKLNLDNVKMITYSEPSSREELATWFRKSKALYTFDAISAVSEEARGCGCPVYFVPNSAHTSKYYDEVNWFAFKNGAAKDLTEQEIKRANETVSLIDEEVENFFKGKEKHLDNFIDITQDM